MIGARGPLPEIPSCGHAVQADGCVVCAQLARPLACGHTRRDMYQARSGRLCRVCGQIAGTVEKTEGDRVPQGIQIDSGDVPHVASLTDAEPQAAGAAPDPITER